MDTPGRLLRMLALMSSRAHWRAADLAERLEVTERSIRRDITRLRDLGYPVRSVTGPMGGYSLAAGATLPPLLLDDDEAVSIAVALRDVANNASAALADGALSALTKLGQVMPTTLRDRVAALSSVVVDIDRRVDPYDDDDDASNQVEALMTLAVACSRSERVRFDYRSGEGTETVRHVEPFRLVSLGRRWYLVANDIDRADWRTFRVDRISRVRNNGARFTRGETPDAAALVAAGIAVNAYSQRALIEVAAPAHEVARYIAPTVGLVSADPLDARRSIVEIGGEPDWIARFLVGLPLTCRVIDSPDVTAAVRSIAHQLLVDHR
jgi:predicted DNA-binding transcriptional regulator YafY